MNRRSMNGAGIEVVTFPPLRSWLRYSAPGPDKVTVGVVVAEGRGVRLGWGVRVGVAEGSGVGVAVRVGVRVEGSTVGVAVWMMEVDGGPQAAPTRLRKRRIKITLFIQRLPEHKNFLIVPPRTKSAFIIIPYRYITKVFPEDT
jgi:hypothetical protein